MEVVFIEIEIEFKVLNDFDKTMRYFSEEKSIKCLEFPETLPMDPPKKTYSAL